MNKKNWITFPDRASCVTFLRNASFPKNLKKATISITSMGWYRLFVNGTRMDKDTFSPGWTDFWKRVQFQTYEITSFLKENSEIRVDIGEGWGGSSRFAWSNNKRFTYFPISLNYEIEYETEDGVKGEIHTDPSVLVYTNDVVSSGLYEGETQDYRRPLKLLGNAVPIEINAEIIPQEGLPIVDGERIQGKKLFVTPKGETVIDFGQNFTGVVEANVQGKEGEILSYIPGEALDADGNFYRDNYRSAECFYSFVLSGKREVLRPKFSFLGGRYIKLIEAPSGVKAEDFTAVLVHSDLKMTCEFSCGNPKIQRLYLNTLYGMLSNYLDVPTDCPQRDERLGWTADTQVFCETASIHCDTHDFFVKWLHDMILDQKEDGSVTAIIPRIGNNCEIVSIGWSDAATIVPWEIYRAFGDEKLLRECVPMMEKWVRYLDAHQAGRIVELPFCFGDWLALDKVQTTDYPGSTRFDLLSTAFYAHSAELLAKAKDALSMDSTEDWARFESIKESYRNAFLPKGHLIGEKARLFGESGKTCVTQTAHAVTLAFGLCTDEEAKLLADDLASLVREDGTHLTTGFLGTPYLLMALSDHGHSKLAHDILFQESYPSWLYSVNRGATTMWEHYDSIKEDGSFANPHMNSLNHYAYGAVFSWIYSRAVGIRIKSPAYSKIEIAPIPDERFGHVDCTYHAKQGDVHVKWSYEKSGIHYEIQVPSGIAADIALPGVSSETFPNGCSLVKDIPFDSFR